MLDYLKNVLHITDEQKNAWYKHWVEEGITAVETFICRYRHGTYCFGDTPILADCCLVPQVANALRMGCDLERFEMTMAIYRHCLLNPDFKRADPRNQADYTH